MGLLRGETQRCLAQEVGSEMPQDDAIAVSAPNHCDDQHTATCSTAMMYQSQAAHFLESRIIHIRI
jgi:hypothetical protein